ncbi:glycoside hydrolase family 3 C-terminal domain-containing protein [Streptomyces sp. SM11]|uniref:glycoside hydrolase family 3 C-terminal domain-containing protein n=1 Tax=Streptomyces sp. SM11 TaxID=565557 RepID=UPI000CD51265|nr:glycoside hydrolase family 3 C-terminal domain-containing protein [Streptomyces sp. SM11]
MSDHRPDAAARVRDLTLEQKAALTSGRDFWHLQDLPEADVPSVMVADGPHGLRKQPKDADPIGLGTSLPATCFPPAVTLGSSWDPDLTRRVGRALGREARAARVSVLLGPGVNIKRSPLCGRNFEYFSEDPFLAGRVAAAYVHGVQELGVGTSLKHFAANNQETDRMRVSADIDERTLREIYLPAFEYVVKDAQPRTVMCAYNKLNGTYTAEHRWLLTGLLREEWGFEGLVVSDWGAVNDRVAAIAAGLDIEMPPSHSDHLIVEAVRDGRLDETAVDTAARRVLELLDATEATRHAFEDPDYDAHHALAREAASAGAVLLKNDDGLLPLNPTGIRKLAVIGEFARTPRYQGAGSSQVVPTRVDTALEALTDTLGADRVTFTPGFALDGVPDPGLVAAAVAAARDADTVVVFLGLPQSAESEGYDRAHMDLPAHQLELLAAVHEVNPRTVVVLSNGSAVSVSPWQRHAAALLEGWLLGQAGGTATADLLFGRTEPGGRLTETIPVRLEDNPSHLHFPGGEQRVRYAEGVFVGYRYYDTLDVPVAYPFGFGLGYTTFTVADGGPRVARTDANTFDVEVDITNTGDRAGSQVVQLYVHDAESPVGRPEQELKGFAKLTLAPGETGTARFRLDERAFAYWSSAESRWKVEPGTAQLRVGFSSRDIRATHEVTTEGNRPADAPRLDAMSTVLDWLSDPVGAEILMPLLNKIGEGAEREMPPEARKMLAQLPMSKIALFTGQSAAATAELVERYRTALDTEAAPSTAG